MALNATVFKFSINLSDFNRNIYDRLNLTVALHPSETLERMLARVIAYCLHVVPNLSFTKGLSTPNSPDIWLQHLTGETDLWIEVGEPTVDKIKRATRLASSVWVYPFNSKCDVWWGQQQSAMARLPVTVKQMGLPPLESLAETLLRNSDWVVTISDNSVYVVDGNKTVEIPITVLQNLD